ncbi:MAG: hypothetical protein KAW66_08535 [Candidatus Lokiarchaeota archaeon]|nr:hypothetical protein [Candidatus Lokiarchaeota archaeon]
MVSPDKGADIAKIILKQPREIPFVTKWRVFNAAAGLDGLKAYHLIYTERGKAEEAMGGIIKYFMPFLNVEGFRYLFEPLMGVSDSYDLMGMKWD